jgi:hypothetical protein
MATSSNKLKAFVRFDGTGRIIPSSLIVQAFKPKVGNWQEIDANECCNYIPITTTTTTTSEAKRFQDLVYRAEKSSNACDRVGGGVIFVSGDGTTFCNSTILTGNEFGNLPPGQLSISYDGQVRTANHGAEQKFVTFITGCSNCP